MLIEFEIIILDASYVVSEQKDLYCLNLNNLFFHYSSDSDQDQENLA